jgi:uncharacterized iron-regulated membrane protein
MLFIRKLHKWLGLIVGLQLLLWAVSGVVFAWLDHHEVTAEHSVRPATPAPLSSAALLVEPSAWLNEQGTHIYEIRLTPLVDQWVWRVESDKGVELRDAERGAPVKLAKSDIERLALSRYAGNGRLQSIEFQPTPSIETRDAGAVWKAQFDDAANTTLYFGADDGRLVAARNSSWRLFDLFWMLHTMDYEGRDNFNNPLVITVGTAALWLSLSGFVLLFRSFRRRDFDLIGAWRRRETMSR